MTPKEYLQQFREINMDIKLCNDRIEEKRMSIMSISSPTLDPNKVQTSISGTDTLDMISQLYEQINNLQLKIAIKEAVRDGILDKIDGLVAPRGIYRRVLERIYIKEEKIWKIANCEHEPYSEGYIKKVHHDALVLFGRQYGYDVEEDETLWTIGPHH